jgi:hypothetical protein
LAEFLPGVELCRVFYTTAVRPLLDAAHPGLPHAAARIGPGSDVLGYDTQRSTDHDWGPQLTLLLSPGDLAAHGDGISRLLRDRLPTSVLGWPTNFEPPGERVRVMTATDGPVEHRVGITALRDWAVAQLGVSSLESAPDGALSSAPDGALSSAPGGAAVAGLSDISDFSFWLGVSGQRLAEAVGGAVFHDSTGELSALRERLAWYPEPVWRYLLAAEWTQIGQEEPFVGRALEAGDELGSLVIAARLARRVMRLALLLRRRYPPYSKWLGTAFGRLGFPVDLAGIGDPDRRQDVLCDAYETAGRWQNDLGLAAPVDPARRPYHNRPYPVLDAARFATALWPGPAPLGAVDQFADSTDLLMDPALSRAVAGSALLGQSGRGRQPAGRAIPSER